MSILTAEQKADIVSGIQAAVDQFNKAFSTWMEETDCRANFGWSYGADKSPKQLTLLDIDARIYHRPISGTLQESLNKLKPPGVTT